MNSGKLKETLPDRYEQTVNFYKSILEVDEEENGSKQKEKSPSKRLSPEKTAKLKSPSSKNILIPKQLMSNQETVKKPKIKQIASGREDLSDKNLLKWAKFTEGLLELRYEKLIRNITRKFLNKLEHRGRWSNKHKTIQRPISSYVVSSVGSSRKVTEPNLFEVDDEQNGDSENTTSRTLKASLSIDGRKEVKFDVKSGNLEETEQSPEKERVLIEKI